MKNGRNITRRQFVKGAAAASAFTIVPRFVLGGTGELTPSEKLNIAAVGVAGMGRANVDACKSHNIVALCDVDLGKAQDTFSAYATAKTYQDFRVMLDKEKGIEGVIVATPDHTHAVVAVTAMRMCKHVYVQKPLTYSVYEARRLAEVAREMKVATQMGNQGHSGEDIRLEREWIQAGAIGQVREVHAWTNRPVWPQGVGRPKDTPEAPKGLDWDLWIGPAPTRAYHPCYHPFTWRGWLDFGTGALGDMGCHIIDHAYWALDLGHPTAVEAYGSARVLENWSVVENKETYPDASIVRYYFPSRGDKAPVTLTWYDGGLKPPRPEGLEPERKLGDGGMIFIGDKGAMLDGRLIPEMKMKEYERPAKTIPRIQGSHEEDWIRACKGGPAACSNFDYAGPLTETTLLGNVALRCGQRIEWDPVNLKVANVPEANRYIQREYRSGWSL